MVKSECTLDKSVTLFDVGHGDSLLLMNRYDQGLLVDCGSWEPHLHIEVPNTIESVLPKNNNCGFIISHYHFDHFSLFHWLTNSRRLFSKIYVPWIPFEDPGLELGRAIMDYLSAAVLVDYSYYRILPEIFGKTAFPVVPCKKGIYVKEASQNLRVLWPDILHPILGTDKIRRIARNVKGSIEPLLSDFGFRVPDFGKEDSVAMFFGYLQDLKDQKLSEERKRTVQKVLDRLEGAFRKMANLLSLVATSYGTRKSRLLLLGDADEDTLDNLTIPGKGNYFCIKAAHHGASFGNALLNLSTEFLLISRNLKEFSHIGNIHPGYLMAMQHKFALSTEFLHHCLIL